MHVDLDELARKEGEQVEWKENVADTDDVVATLSAFANDLQNLGGGYVVCGAAEVRDDAGFPSIRRQGLTAARLREVESKVLTDCRDRVSPPITPLIEELPSDVAQGRLLVFIQPSTRSAHQFRSRKGPEVHYVRVGRTTIQARNGILRELLVRKGAQEPWDRRPCSGATIDDIDLLALRDALARMGIPGDNVDAYLSGMHALSPFVPPLCMREPLTGVLRPLNFAMLLFGRDVQRFVAGAVAIVSTYPGKDTATPHAERLELAGTIVEQAQRIRGLMSIQAGTVYDKRDPSTPNVVKYPTQALYEAIGNAAAHRDYEVVDPTRVRVFEDRVEFISPGSLPLGVRLEDFREGRAHPKWRNQALAWFFTKLQLAQAEGQGIPTILRSMRDEGCPPPRLEADENSVVCTLPAHPRHALIARLRESERALARGEFELSRVSIREVLAQDPTNEWALRLFAEVHQALRDPEPLTAWVQTHRGSLAGYSAEVLLTLSEALLAGVPTDGPQRETAGELLAIAAGRRMAEGELRRLGVALNRAREHKRALSLVDDYFRESPARAQSAALLQVRGDAQLGLAKMCRTTATTPRQPLALRQRAWREHDAYLADAERDLRHALDGAADEGLRQIIVRNLDFLQQLRKPPSGRR